MSKTYDFYFSIIIPVYNEDTNIQNLFLEIISTLINYKNYEIIFVNDCSTDNTLNILQLYI